MSRRENESNGNNGNTANGANGIYYDGDIRRYSRRHSYYDDAFNMDFEYSYFDLMNSFGRFVSRTQDIYSDMQTCISSMIELQNERRRIVNRRRQQHFQNNRDLHERQHIVFNDSNDSNNNDTTIIEGSQGSQGSQGSRTTSNSDIPPVTRGVNNGVRNPLGLGRASLPGLSRSPLFDMGNIFYSIPRTVLLNPNPNPNPNTTLNRRRTGGLTISEIEENTEIMTYGSIPSNYILNTECPITRETFTPESVVLTLKQCKHCFVPFRMMTWLETNSTCPLCRSNVVRAVETTTTSNSGVENTTNETNANGANSANDANSANGANSANDANHANDANGANSANGASNLSISDILNTLMQNSNNEFDNLSVDNVNDNSIMFSFDIPRSQLSGQNTNGETSIIPQIERLFANTLSRSNGSNSGSNSTHDSTRDTIDDTNYPEVD